MKFPLRPYHFKSPIPSLSGTLIRYRPVIPITVSGPAATESSFVLVDSGSDDVVFPIATAHRIGIDLTHAPKRSSRGVGSSQGIGIMYADVMLLLSDSQETARWKATVGFTTAALRFPLFGIAGGLEFFRTTLDVSNREIELVMNASLPTTP